MNPLVPRVSLPLVPAALAATLLVADLALLLKPAEVTVPDVPPSRARPRHLFDGTPAPPAPDPAIARETLFTPSRSLDAATSAAGAAGGVRADPFAGGQLVGIARARGYAVALYRDVTGHTVSVRTGDRIGSWRVVAIGTDRAVFARPGATRTLIVGETAVVQPPSAQGTQGERAQ